MSAVYWIVTISHSSDVAGWVLGDDSIPWTPEMTVREQYPKCGTCRHRYAMDSRPDGVPVRYVVGTVRNETEFVISYKDIKEFGRNWAVSTSFAKLHEVRQNIQGTRTADPA